MSTTPSASTSHAGNEVVARRQQAGSNGVYQRVDVVKGTNGVRHVHGLRNGALLLASEPMASEKRLAREDFDADGFCLTPSARAFVLRLFDGLMTIHDAKEFFSSEFAQYSCIMRVNKAFREFRGADAVLRTGFDGMPAVRGNFYFLHLNPEFFDVPPATLVPGKDFSWRDFLDSREQIIFKCLLDHPYSSAEQVSNEVEINKRFVQNALCCYINKKMRAVGLPEPVKKTPRLPTLYFVDPAFIKLFKGEVKPAKICREVFSKNAWTLITYFAEHPNKWSAEVKEGLGLSETGFYKLRKAIMEKAALFGLAAFDVSDAHGRKRISLSTEFADALGLVASRVPVPDLFCRDDLQLLESIVEEPCSSQLAMAGKLGVSKRTIFHRCRRVLRICRQNKLDGLVVVKRMPAQLYTTREFAAPFVERFGWRHQPLEPRHILSEIVLGVYNFFLQHPSASITECAATVGMSAMHVEASRRECNKKLAKHCLPCLPSLERVSPFRNYSAACEAVVEFRMKFGVWPSRHLLQREGMNSLDDALAKYHGGAARIVNKMRASESVVKHVARSDLEKLRKMVEDGKVDFDIFREESKTVARLAASAVREGAELGKIARILQKSWGYERTVEALNALILASPLSTIKHDHARASAPFE